MTFAVIHGNQLRADTGPSRACRRDAAHPPVRGAVHPARPGQGVPGHYHVYIGQEATAVAACAALTPEDFVFTTWRNHGHLLARGAAPDRMMAEILGKAGGYAGGKQRHAASVGRGNSACRRPRPWSAAPCRSPTGAALACKRRGSGVDRVLLRRRRARGRRLLRGHDHRGGVAGADPVRLREQQHPAGAAQARTIHLVDAAGGAPGGRAAIAADPGRGGGRRRRRRRSPTASTGSSARCARTAVRAFSRCAARAGRAASRCGRSCRAANGRSPGRSTTSPTAPISPAWLEESDPLTLYIRAQVAAGSA